MKTLLIDILNGIQRILPHPVPKRNWEFSFFIVTCNQTVSYFATSLQQQLLEKTVQKRNVSLNSVQLTTPNSRKVLCTVQSLSAKVWTVNFSNGILSEIKMDQNVAENPAPVLEKVSQHRIRSCEAKWLKSVSTFRDNLLALSRANVEPQFNSSGNFCRKGWGAGRYLKFCGIRLECIGISFWVNGILVNSVVSGGSGDCYRAWPPLRRWHVVIDKRH